MPGRLDAITDAETAVRIAREVGFPVMLKAAAGGGGKGMRIARTDAEVRDGFRVAAAEARASFADDRLFIERHIDGPRHIEIQVLGDAFGTVAHLFERECSIQRRHQKVIEEAPAPNLPEATRAAMGDAAVALARAVQYRSAGTVEFLLGRDGAFHFLEMNTRLQVEHPVTEAVTGLDLVELMIRIAAGERLPFAQDEIRIERAAIEARLYAEDPYRGFVPSIGRLTRYAPPTGEGIRVDTGVFEGAEISPYYDPMIAKLIVAGPTREAAVERLGEALDSFEIAGPAHNLPFLGAIAANPRFRAGRMTTDFIAEEFPAGFSGRAIGAEDESHAIAVAAAMRRIMAEHEGRIGNRAAPEAWTVCRGEARHPVRTARDGDMIIVTGADSSRRVATSWQQGQSLLAACVDGVPHAYQVAREGIGIRLSRAGWSLVLLVLSPRAAELLAIMPDKTAADPSHRVLSPIPGLLVSIAVAEGQEVKAGEEIAVIEAMKMENMLRAERDGTVVKIHARPGDTITADQIIFEFA